MDDSKKLFPLLVEAIDHMKLTPSKKEFAKAVMRTAIEYAAMRQAGYVLEPPGSADAGSRAVVGTPR